METTLSLSVRTEDDSCVGKVKLYMGRWHDTELVHFANSETMFMNIPAIPVDGDLSPTALVILTEAFEQLAASLRARIVAGQEFLWVETNKPKEL